MTPVIEIEGIGKAYAKKLEAVGVKSVEGLLEAGATPKLRQELAERSGLSSKLLLKWLNRADLFRIKGVGTQFSDLLEAAGVDTVVELTQRNPANLHAKIVEVNAEKKLTRALPSAESIASWIEHAKTLPRVLSY